MSQTPLQDSVIAVLARAQPQSTARIAAQLGSTRADIGFVLGLMRAAGLVRHAKIAAVGEGRGWKLARPLNLERTAADAA